MCLFLSSFVCNLFVCLFFFVRFEKCRKRKEGRKKGTTTTTRSTTHKKAAFGEETVVLLFFGRSRSLGCVERARTFGLSRATRSWRGTRGTPRDTPSKNSRRYDPSFRRSFVVVVLFRNDASSIDRSTVVVSRYWTPRACGRDHSIRARHEERKRGVVARVARTLSNNTNNLLVVIIHHHHHLHR